MYPQVNLVGDLVEQLKQNFPNNNIFIPLLQTFNVLFEGGALDSLNGSANGEKQWVYPSRSRLSGNSVPTTDYAVCYRSPRGASLA